jgi:hypothetical protein
MKRTGFLYHKVCDFNNICLAYCKAYKGKAGKKEVINFVNNLGENLNQLQTDLITGNIKVGDYHYFKIYDPKERIICAASFKERILHHSLMNVCDEHFERFQIYHSYATRKNKGTHKAIEYAKKQTYKYKYFLKMDVRKYFDSVDQNTLINLLQRRFKDDKLLSVFEDIIRSYSVQEGKGLPIGNLTSQYFANYYLAFLDHYINEELHISKYVRYMDDMIIWSNHKDDLKEYLKSIKTFLSNKLLLELKPSVINYCKKGLSFLGYRIFLNEILLNNRSKRRFILKSRKYQKLLDKAVWTQKEYQNHILPLINFVVKANTYNLRKSIFQRELIEEL